jgi:ArsR family transcriptional regulator
MKKTAHLFKALSDETRLRILALLTLGELCVCDLMSVLELPQSTVSRHLAYLRNTGLVEDRRQGVWMYYRLAEGDGGFRRELQAILQEHLADLPQGKADRASLGTYFLRKESSACE